MMPSDLAHLRSLAESLDTVVLLAGSIRGGPLRRIASRHFLDLPIAETQTLLGFWVRQFEDLADSLGLAHLRARIVVDRQAAALPRVPATSGRVDVSVEHDPVEYRGTAGVVRDLMPAASAGSVLICTAAQLPVGRLADHVRRMSAMKADAVLHAEPDASPSGVMLCRWHALAAVPTVGFHDLKEQVLPLLAKQHNVRVAPGLSQSFIPLQTLNDYLSVVRWYATSHAADGGAATNGAFCLVEAGATIGRGAVLQDTVVLRGATISGSAVVARSLVAEGVTVADRETVTDRLLVNASDS
jgi:hypothetical protein